MGTDPNKNLAGPLVVEQSVIDRDALIREENDGERIDDAHVRSYVDQHKQQIFRLQSEFFTELRDKESQIKT